MACQIKRSEVFVPSCLISHVEELRHVIALATGSAKWRSTTFSCSTHPCKPITRTLSQPPLIAEPAARLAAMASGRDVRDMLGLPAGADVPKAAIQKRPKPAGASRKIRTSGYSHVYPWDIVKRARLTLIRPEGVAREVAALYGERPPPVAVYEEKKAYRAKRQSTGPAKKWYATRDCISLWSKS